MNRELFVTVVNFISIRHGALTHQLQVLSQNGSTLKVQMNGCEDGCEEDGQNVLKSSENGHKDDLDGQNIVLDWE